MQKKILHSDISLDMMPIVETKSRKCKICNKKLKMMDKMIVFDDNHIPMGYCCRYCKTVYGDRDVLIMIGNKDGSGIYGEG